MELLVEEQQLDDEGDEDASLLPHDFVRHERSGHDEKDAENDEVLASLDEHLQFMESNLAAFQAQGDSDDDDDQRVLRKGDNDAREKPNVQEIQQQQEEDARWVVVELPATSTGAALEVFQAKKWREISRLAKAMAASCFHGIRVGGNDHALYEGFFRAFPHHIVTKARFTSVMRHIYGISAVAVPHQPSVAKKPGDGRSKRRSGGEGSHNNGGHDSVRAAAVVTLDRQLEKLQFCCERSSNNVLVLHWRTLLTALRMFLEPLLTMREHLVWAFSVFASSGCLELNNSDVVDVARIREGKCLVLSIHSFRFVTAHSVVLRVQLQAALNMLPSARSSSLSGASIASSLSSRISYRTFRLLLQLPPLRTLINHRVTPYTSTLDELSVPVYRDHVFGLRRREHDRCVLRRLRYFHNTKIVRLCFHMWARFASERKALRSTMSFTYAVIARTKQHAAFRLMRRHALANIAALEIQRVYRGMRGRMRAEAAWRQMQAVLAVQGAFRMRAHFTKHLRALRRRNLLAIRLQRAYRGRLGRIQARQVLLTYYYREMAAIQKEREAFREFVRGEMARRLQRFFRRLVVGKQRVRQAEEKQKRQAAGQEMLERSQDVAYKAARHRRDVAAKYDRLRQEAEQQKKRRVIDALEKQKVVHLRRERQWEAFKAEKLARKEVLKRESAESYERLKVQWEATIMEKTHKRGVLVGQVLQLEEPGAEWKKLHDQLQRQVKERVKQLSGKYKASGTVVPKKEIHERAQREIVEEEATDERQKAEAAFLRQLDDAEEKRTLAANAEERATRQKSAVTVQCAYRAFSARRLLRQKLRKLYVKDFDVKTQTPQYRNTITDQCSTRKPRAFGSEDLEYEDRWAIIEDDVLGTLAGRRCIHHVYTKESRVAVTYVAVRRSVLLGERFFYNPKRMLQSWELPDDCQICGPCSGDPSSAVVFAAVWNSQENIYLCQTCYEQEVTARYQHGDFREEAYMAHDGSRRNG
ncbi:hypothetical protein BBJ28_00004452 [Nothophytophthora sp. Chile5]|nr:hypothetical protein BBJ28_00004452 [Nothophytophthora sp. Chile5]